MFIFQELESLIRVNKLTHKLLSEHLALDDFKTGLFSLPEAALLICNALYEIDKE